MRIHDIGCFVDKAYMLFRLVNSDQTLVASVLQVSVCVSFFAGLRHFSTFNHHKRWLVKVNLSNRQRQNRYVKEASSESARLVGV